MIGAEKKGQVILLACSSGGHLKQMSRLYESLKEFECVLCTSAESEQVPLVFNGLKQYKLSDANKSTPILILRLFFESLAIAIKCKSVVVISTGAAPGLMVLIITRIVRPSTRAIWVDSLANVERLSLSGRLARRLSNLCVSQWEDVANASDVSYLGKLI